MRVGILVFDDVDIMDVAGPYEVLLTASRLEHRRGEEPSFEVLTITPWGESVTACGGLGLFGHLEASHVEDLDLLVVPGAVAIDRIQREVELIGVIERLAERAQIITSVCTGAFLLERAGLLGGRQATTHWEDVRELAARLGPDSVRDDVRWVDDGTVVTAGGLSSGIAMALHLVERFAGRDLAEATAKQIDYLWAEERIRCRGP